QTAEGQTAEGQTAEGQTAEGQTAEGQTAEGQTAEGQTAEGQTAEGQTAEGQTAEVANVAPTEAELLADKNLVAADGLAKNAAVATVASDTGGNATKKGVGVENLSRGEAIEIAKQAQLQDAALKDAVVTKADSAASQVATVTAEQSQLNEVVSAVKPEMLQNSVNAGQQIDGVVLKTEKLANTKTKVITDPRFASLLNKPEVSVALRQQQGETGVNVQSGMANSDSAAGFWGGADDAVGSANLAVSSDVTSGNNSRMSSVVAMGHEFANMQFASADAMATDASAQLHNGATNAQSATPTANPVLTLKDGSMVPESRVVQQTIDHLSLHARGDSSSVTIKLHPEELGELQLRMVMEGDKLRVHLHTQSQQVQEVLERNFPRLRDALQDAGVNVSDFQVSSDAGQSSNQQNFAQNEFSQAQGTGQFSEFAEDDIDPLAPVIAATAVAPSDSLSVRV
ncbi:MAG: flagellar hook-length control protein FliK, partial [Desulfuromonas sp.]|nr:flagellar hook-length control protein FliK [Desulfuromonas sp.]